jgi:ribose transport system substrate-binding protein
MLAALAAIATVAVIAGCGSSSSSSSSASSSAGAVPAAAKEETTKWSTRPTQISVTQKVAKPIPTGKTIAYIHCGLPACNTWASAIKEAAKKLGWTAKIHLTTGTAESVQAAWKEVVREAPDAVLANGFDKEVFSTQLAELKAKKIPVIESFVTDPPGDGINLVLGGPQTYRTVGEIEAAKAVELQGSKANMLYVNLPAYKIVQPAGEGVKAEFSKLCSSCKLTSINVPVTALGKESPGLITSYLRAHPEVNVDVNSQSALSEGLPAALKAAGISEQVKIIDDAPTPTNYAYIKGGEQAASVNVPIQSLSWQMVDAAARLFTGESVAADEKDPQWWLLDKSNIPAEENFSNVAGYQAQYEQLWGK